MKEGEKLREGCRDKDREKKQEKCVCLSCFFLFLSFFITLSVALNVPQSCGMSALCEVEGAEGFCWAGSLNQYSILRPSYDRNIHQISIRALV